MGHDSQSVVYNLELPLVIGALISDPLSVYFVKKVEFHKFTPYLGGAAVILGVSTLFKVLFDITVLMIAVVIIFIALVVTMIHAEYRNRTGCNPPQESQQV